jgi:hypothetical protein
MEVLRFVHLSDIHFGQEKNGNLIFHEDVRDRLIDNCAEIRSELGNANGVLVTGDIAYSGKPSQYARAGQWLDRLTKAVGCDLTAVRTVPGNHDVDVSEINHFADMAYSSIRSGGTAQAEEELAKCIEGNEEGNPLWPQQRAYREFAERYGCGFESLQKPCWTKDYSLDPFALRIIGLNSAQISKPGETLGQLILAKSQYIIGTPDNFVQVVMFHHPLEWLKNATQVNSYVTSRAQVLMVGHDHRSNLNKVQGLAGNEWLVIWAGATNPNERESDYTYNWLEFSFRQVENSYELVINVYPQIWKKNETRFIRDTNRLDGARRKEVSLACPNLKRIPPPPRAATTPGKLDSTASPGEVCPSMTTPSTDENKFARLRYFFWGFLDWQDRLTILANLKVLPKVPEKQIPQTMERIALDVARERKKLARLWEAVMEIVPPDKREANPFLLDQE